MENLHTLKLISLNVEGHRHVGLQKPFFAIEKPDILCLQEVLESDFDSFREELGMNGKFVPMCLVRRVDDAGKEILDQWGIGMLAKLPLENMTADYYFGDPTALHEFISDSTPQDEIWKVLLTGTVKTPAGEEFIIGTTHFTWSKGGIVDENQRRDLRVLFEKLACTPEIVLCGDFNAPRGREVFGLIADKYKDNIPEQYTTSIDGALHRRGPIPYMVDGLFTTLGYCADKVRLQDGVSDHCAIIAEIAVAHGH